MHCMVVGHDCHSHVAEALNNLKYRNCTSWNKVLLAGVQTLPECKDTHGLFSIRVFVSFWIMLKSLLSKQNMFF